MATPASPWIETTVNLQWPSLPDPARIRYLREFKGGSEFQNKSTSQKIVTWLTGEEEKRLPFVNPYGIAADGLGRIWVSDMGIHGVHQIDLPRRKVTYLFNAGDIPLATPAGIAVDKERNRLYLSDSTLGKVFLFDLKGRYLEAWNAPDGFARPTGLAVAGDGKVYVVDTKKNRITVFSKEGQFLRNITSNAPPDFTFNLPSNVAVNAQGQIFVVDSMNFRIESFTPGGESLGTFGSVGDGPGYFARPRGIALDSEGHIYVADAIFDNIQVYDQSGKLLIFFGQSGKKEGEFSLPAGITFDQKNRLYVVDSYNQRIQIFEYLP